MCLNGKLAKRICASRAARSYLTINRTVVGLVVLALTCVEAHAETTITIRNLSETTFALIGSAATGFTPGQPRESKAGTAQPQPGELTVGMFSTYAVGRPKLHVFERTTKAIAFKVTSMHGMKRLGTDQLCGHLETDTWIVLPEETSRAVLSDFAEVKGDCP